MSKINTREGNWCSAVLVGIIAFAFTPWAEPTFPYVLWFVVVVALLGLARALWLATTTVDRLLTPVEQRVAQRYREYPDTTPEQEAEVIAHYYHEMNEQGGWGAGWR